MSGAEILGIISAAITIVETTISVYNAAKDQAGLPPHFKTVATKLPLVLKLLDDAERYVNQGADDATTETFAPILADCKDKAAQMQHMFEQVIAVDGDSRRVRYLKAARTIGKGGRVEELAKGILEALNLMTTQFPTAVSPRSQKSLTEAIEEVGKLEPSLPDGFESQAAYTHYGSGSQNVNTGDGIQYNNTSTGNQNHGQGQQYIGTNHIDSSVISGIHAMNIGYVSADSHNYYFAPARPPTPPTPTYIMPYRRDHKGFIQRKVMDEIRRSCTSPGFWRALVGFGGVGKSQLAIEYAYRTRQQSPGTWVFWIHASSYPRFEKGFRDIARCVKVPGREDPNADIFQLVYDWLQEGKGGAWTIILDNVDDLDFLNPPGSDPEAAATTVARESSKQLESYIPCCDHGSVLITSRSMSTAEQLVESDSIILIEPMDKAEALALLCSALGQSDDEASAVQLVTELELMPLAIAQAAAYILKSLPQCSLKRYLDEFRKGSRERARVLGLQDGILRHDVNPNIIGLSGKDYRRDPENKNSILLTWQISFDYIRKTRSSAANLLSLMSFCDRQGIPRFLLRNGISSHLPGNDERIQRDDALFANDIATLQSFLFISSGEDGNSFEMHRLVQLATREWLRAHGSHELWQHQFLVGLNAKFPTGQYEDWAQCEALFPHVQSILTERPAADQSMKEWARIVLNAADYARRKGKLTEAASLSMQAMEARKRIYGEDHIQVICSKALVARIHHSRGNFGEAERLTVQAMDAFKKQLGGEHLHTLASMTDLAEVYAKTGRLQRAEELLDQVVEAHKRQLGENHPEALCSTMSLARLYMQTGRWRQAEELLVPKMDIYRKQKGEHHPDTLQVVTYVCKIYEETGRSHEAKKFLEPVEKARKRQPGERDLNALGKTAQLAGLYAQAGRWQAAEELLVPAIVAHKKQPGEDTSAMLRCMAHLSEMYRNTGRLQEAEELLTQVVPAREKLLGEDSMLTLASMRDLAEIYGKTGRFEAAERLQVQVVESEKKRRGEDHPITLFSMIQLAITYKKHRRWQAAEALLVQVLEAQESKSGEADCNTLIGMHLLAEVYRDTGRLDRGRSLMRRVQSSRAELGVNHPEALRYAQITARWAAF